MHKSDYSVRADDFRNAWPLAYQLCMSQVAEVVRQADSLLLNCKTFSQDAQRFADHSGQNLMLVANQVADTIKAASDSNAAVMASGVTQHLDGAKRVIIEERKLRAGTQALVDKLAADKAEFELLKREFRELPLLQRLWMAIRPDGVFL